MAHSLIAHIDESGDDDFQAVFGCPEGMEVRLTGLLSARWVGASHAILTLCWAREILAQMPTRQRQVLHSKDLDHAQRIMVINGICARPMRMICVIANKPSKPSRGQTARLHQNQDGALIV